MKVSYLGHAGFIVRSRDATLLIDPWLTENPQGSALPDDVRPDLIALTHGHFDHVGDSLELADRFAVPILTLPELASYCRDRGATTELINYGGSFFQGHTEIKCVLAFHSSSGGTERANAPGACGYVVRDGSVSLYHAGDTCVFGDMKMIGDRSNLEVAVLPIGGRTTMDPEEAMIAIELLRPRHVIPIHFDTWEFIQQDVHHFKSDVESRFDTTVVVLKPGDSAEFGEARTDRIGSAAEGGSR